MDASFRKDDASGSADAGDQRCGGTFEPERDGNDLAAPALHFLAAHNCFNWPVATLDQDIGAATEYEIEGGVLLEPGGEAHAFQRRHQRQAVIKGVDRSVRALAQTPYRLVRV